MRRRPRRTHALATCATPIAVVAIALVGLSACAEQVDDTEAAANEEYLLGMEYYQQGGSNLRQAIDHFTRSVDLDSTFALGYAGLARAHASIGGQFNVLSPEQTFPKAKEAAEKAVALDDDLAEAHLAQAYVKDLGDWDWTGAEREYQRALELDSANVEILTSYAWFLVNTKRADEAAALVEKARDLAPAAWTATAQLDYLITGNAVGPVQLVKDLIEADPNNPAGYWWLGNIYTQEGDFEGAAEQLQKQIPLMEGDVVDEVALLGHVYGRMGREEDARRMLERLDELSDEGRYVSPVLKAWIHSGLGEAEEAVAWLREGYEARAHRSGLQMNGFSFVYEPISEDPSFVSLLEEMGLPR
jgi:adenylate cyclase